MKNIGGETQKIFRMDDEITSIGYKIIYRRSKNIYEIWTQYYDTNHKLHRNRVRTDIAIELENDGERLIEYVKNVLVAEHYSFYKNGVFLVDLK